MNDINNCISAEYLQMLKDEYWCKCMFCSAYNGLFGKTLQQHKARCLFIGDAKTYSNIRDNYNDFICEDDKAVLPILRKLYGKKTIDK